MPDTLVTLHVADIWREPRMKYPTLLDWAKVPRYLAGTWPKPISPRIVADVDTAHEALEWLEEACHAPYVVIDTEYASETKVLQLIGLGYPSMTGGAQIPWLWTGRTLPPFWRDRLAGAVRALVQETPVVFQNAVADIRSEERRVGKECRL